VTARLPRVYAAHPMCCYHTDYAADRLAAVARHFPRWRVLDPSRFHWSNAEWQEQWPALVPTLSALVIFADWTGTVGTGVMRELTDVLYAGLPVYVLDDDLRLCELAGLALLEPRTRRPAAVAYPVAGEPVHSPTKRRVCP